MGTFYIVKNDNDLLHYGVLGMKWGVRKETPRLKGSLYRKTGSRKYKNNKGQLTEKGKQRYLQTTAKDKRLNSAKLAIWGSLSGGSGAALAGAIAGTKLSNKQADKLIDIGKTVFTAELAVVGNILFYNYLDQQREAMEEANRKIRMSELALRNAHFDWSIQK